MHPRKWPRAVALMLAATLAGCAAAQPHPPVQLGADSRLRVAAAAEAAGDDDLAASMYSTAAGAAGADTTLLLRCAEGLARLGHPAEARQLLAARAAASHGDPDVVRTLAALDLNAGQPAAAIAGLDVALAARPGDVAALVDKAVALDLQSRHGDAQALYYRALLAAPGDTAILNDLAMSLLLDGHVQDAIAVLAPVQDAVGLPDRARTNLGVMYALAGDAERGRRLIGRDLSDLYLAEIAKAVGAAGP